MKYIVFLQLLFIYCMVAPPLVWARPKNPSEIQVINCQLSYDQAQDLLSLNTLEVENGRPVSVSLEIIPTDGRPFTIKQQLTSKEVFNNSYKTKWTPLYFFSHQKNNLKGQAKLIEIKFANNATSKPLNCATTFERNRSVDQRYIPEIISFESGPDILNPSVLVTKFEVKSTLRPSGYKFYVKLPSGEITQADNREFSLTESGWEEISPNIFRFTLILEDRNFDFPTPIEIKVNHIVVETMSNSTTYYSPSFRPNDSNSSVENTPWIGKSKEVDRDDSLISKLYTLEEDLANQAEQDELHFITNFESSMPPKFLNMKGRFAIISQQKILPFLDDENNLKLNSESMGVIVEGMKKSVPLDIVNLSPHLIERNENQVIKSLWYFNIERNLRNKFNLETGDVYLIIPERLSVELVDETFIHFHPKRAFVAGGSFITKRLIENESRRDNYLKNTTNMIWEVPKINQPLTVKIGPSRKMVLKAGRAMNTFQDSLQLIESTCSQLIVRPKCEVTYEIVDDYFVYFWESHYDNNRVGKPVLLQESNAENNTVIFGEKISDFLFNKETGRGSPVITCDNYNWLPGDLKDQSPKEIRIETWQREISARNQETSIVENRLDESVCYSNIVFSSTDNDVNAFQLKSLIDDRYVDGVDVVRMKGGCNVFRVWSDESSKIIWTHKLSNGETCQNTFGLMRNSQTFLNLESRKVPENVMSQIEFTSVYFTLDYAKSLPYSEYQLHLGTKHLTFPLRNIYQPYVNKPNPFKIRLNYGINLTKELQ